MLGAQEECGKVLGPGQILEIVPKGIKKMITPQECMQLKRELETGYGDEIEVTPAILVLILTFVLFVIAFWIWLISRSCIFAQGPDSKNRCCAGDESGSKTESVSGSRSQSVSTSQSRSSSRLSGGCLSICSPCHSGSNYLPGVEAPARLWRSCPIGLGRNELYPKPMPTYLIPFKASGGITPESSTKTESSAQEATKSSRVITSTSEKQQMAVSSSHGESGSPCNIHQIGTPSGEETTPPRRKYRVKWARLLKRGPTFKPSNSDS